MTPRAVEADRAGIDADGLRNKADIAGESAPFRNLRRSEDGARLPVRHLTHIAGDEARFLLKRDAYPARTAHHLRRMQLCKSTAAPTVGWPANGNSVEIVKIRIAAVSPILGALDEDRLREVEFRRDGLHPLIAKVIRVKHDRERVAGQRRAGKDIERVERAAHAMVSTGKAVGWSSEFILRRHGQDFPRTASAVRLSNP